MATSQQVEDFSDANRGLVVLAQRELETWWDALDTTDAIAVREALVAFLPVLCQQFGEQAALLAADYYDDLRETAQVIGAFRSDLAPPANQEQIAARARWAMGAMFGPLATADGVLVRLTQITDELVKQPGRDTIALNASRDPAKARWARVPVGPTCAFCLLVASRGAVYRSEDTAGRANKYHGDCNCTPTPIWSDDDLPGGYDPDDLYLRYLDAREAAGSNRAKPILAELRSQEGIN